MRQIPLWFCLLGLLPLSAASHQRAKPPGITTGDQVANQPLEAPAQNRNRKIDIEQAKQEAEEMRKLANAVPSQIQQVANNQLPKDLADNLKRIEKLAKHLRGEVTP
ncbi:MAG: hypothetical protein WB987_07505 [Candidatus Acidiferrales bacterium]